MSGVGQSSHPRPSLQSFSAQPLNTAGRTSRISSAADDNASLELEEICSVFRALLSKHIEPLWFTGRIFNASVHESFGLVLRNQRDRFLLSYYEHISVDCPQDEETNRFIWRYVFGLVAHDN
jgi:hypothetical protein